ncbi:MAG: chalcone isomerase family protein [Azonexus sp.]|nr:chalcone isomerase family protein [Azonexus sp.]MCK6412519.1 chalcone isomerase family protein [Azonexus sp.]
MIAIHRYAGPLVAAALFVASGAYAAEVAGVKLDDSQRVASGELLLNGAGLRSKLFIKLYVAALYLPQKTSAAAAVLDAPGPRRMQLRLLRDIGAETLHGALEDGLANNNTAVELDAIKAQSEQFGTLMKGLGKVKEGDSVTLDFGAEALVVSLNGEVRGKVAGAAFGKALLKVWLGEKPADAALKKALLGN